MNGTFAEFWHLCAVLNENEKQTTARGYSYKIIRVKSSLKCLFI
jgi:hypothetical protein